MNHAHRLSSLVAAAAVAAATATAEPNPPPAGDAPPPNVKSSDATPGATGPIVLQTADASVALDLKNGQAKVTITVEKDGKKETRTFTIPADAGLDLTPEMSLDVPLPLFKEWHAAQADTPAKQKVTYLGVMLSEPPALFGGGGFGLNAPSFGPPESATETPAHPGLPPGTGLTVSGITPGSPAEKAGLQTGDVLARLNDQILVNPGQFTTLIRTMKEGESVKLAILRKGEPSTVEATLASREEEATPVARSFSWHAAPSGGLARVLTLDAQGNLVESTPGAQGFDPTVPPPVPPVPPAPPSPPSPAAPRTAESSAGDTAAREATRPRWEQALREAAAAKENAAAQWQAQLSKWRADWEESQKKTAEDYRKAIEKMSEEIAKAHEAAAKAREEARRAVEEVKRRLEERRALPDRKPDDSEPKDPDAPEPPKNA